MKSVNRLALAVLSVLFLTRAGSAQVADTPDSMVANIPVNNTESKVGTYTLPDPLKMFDGRPVTDARMWNDERRPELLKYYQSEIYGRIPATAPQVTWTVVNTDPQALGGKAIMKTLMGRMGQPGAPSYIVTLYTPSDATKPVPVLLSINFNFGGARGGPRGRGPATAQIVGLAENDIPARGAPRGRAPATGPANAAGRRGLRGRGGPVGPPRGTPAELIANGFGCANVYYDEIETDIEGGRSPNLNIVRGLSLLRWQNSVAPDEWGSIAAWAWGISRAVDYMETDPTVDAKRIAITGVSRLGKTVLWEGASDPRIALVIASCSGEGGAALARRNYGETIAHLVTPTRYPYQFAGNYAKYAKDPSTLKVDTHCLVAMVAPRPLLLQTGNTDNWSDPRGEFLAAFNATPVFKLLGEEGMDNDTMPNAGQFVGHTLGYYMHDGGHGTVPSDWDIYLKFMKDHLHPEK